MIHYNIKNKRYLLGYFPAFIKSDNINILIIGGGKIATKRLKYLLDFKSTVTIISPTCTTEMEKIIEDFNIDFKHRVYQKGDIDKFNIVVVAVDNLSLQESIYKEAKLLPRCLVNSVDSVEFCDFIFPSYIKKDDLTITISTNGTSPAFAKQLRIKLQNLIPDTIGNFLVQMKKYRSTMQKGEHRMNFLKNQAKQYILTWGDK